MSQEYKKLRRGLSDVSSLFGTPHVIPSVTQEPSCEIRSFSAPAAASGFIKVVGVHSVANSYKSDLYAAWIASHIASQKIECALIDLEDQDEQPSIEGKPVEHYGAFMKCLVVSRQAWSQLCLNGSPLISHDAKLNHQESEGSQVIFLQTNLDHLSHPKSWFEKMDVLLMVLPPDMDSAIEAYRWLKNLDGLGLSVQYAIVFESAEMGAREQFLFEKMADMASRHLGIQLDCLGNLMIPGKDCVKPVYGVDLQGIFHSSEPMFWRRAWRDSLKSFLKKQSFLEGASCEPSAPAK